MWWWMLSRAELVVAALATIYIVVPAEIYSRLKSWKIGE